MKFTLTNHFGADIDLSLEPEGTIYELVKDDSVEIELSPCVGICVDIQVTQYENRICLAIWPHKGDYQIEGYRDFD
jgi:hypothetical protein